MRGREGGRKRKRLQILRESGVDEAGGKWQLEQDNFKMTKGELGTQKEYFVYEQLRDDGPPVTSHLPKPLHSLTATHPIYWVVLHWRS